MTDQNTTSMSQPTGFAVGDRVRIVADFPSAARGMIGKVVSEALGVYVVRTDRYFDMAYDADELERADTADDLIARVSELGAVEFNRWIADGMLCRRFITPDGSIDLTVRVP